MKPRKVKQKQIKRKIKAKPENGTLNQGSKEVQVLGEKKTINQYFFNAKKYKIQSYLLKNIA